MYKECKAVGIRKNSGNKVFIKFHDDESLVGFIEGEVPWDKGFSLSKLGKQAKGFFSLLWTETAKITRFFCRSCDPGYYDHSVTRGMSANEFWIETEKRLLPTIMQIT
jgi:hypothetical protein